MGRSIPLLAQAGVRFSRFREGPGARVRGHRHDNEHIMFMLAGAAEQRADRRAIGLQAGSARLSGVDAAHDIAFGAEGGECLTVHFPGDRRALGSTFFPARIGASLLAPVLASAAATATLPRAALEARYAQKRFERAGDPAADWLEHAREALLHAASPTVARLASDLGVSREYFSRAFTAAFGVGPRLTRRCARLVRASAALAKKTDAAQVAAEAGYVDQSHMIREFRWAYGATPTAVARGDLGSGHENPIPPG